MVKASVHRSLLAEGNEGGIHSSPPGVTRRKAEQGEVTEIPETLHCVINGRYPPCADLVSAVHGV